MITKNFKAGVIAILTIAAFLVMINYMKGKNIFSRGKVLYAIYEDVNGLMPTKPVTINGMKVGSIDEVDFTDDSSGRIKVTMTIDTDFEFDKNTKAVIYSPGLVSGTEIKLIMSRKGAPVKDGDYIQGEVEPSLATTFGKEMQPLKDQFQKTLVSLDSTLIGIRGFTTVQNQKNIASLISNLDQTAVAYKNLSANVSSTVDKFGNTADHFNQVATEAGSFIAENRVSFRNMINNLQNTSDNFNQVSRQINDANIKQTIQKFDHTVDQLNQMLCDIESGKGTMGKFMKDEKFYNNLQNASKELELLLKDLKENPKRYVHFSLFGKKNATYVAPVKDSIKR